MQAPSLQIDCGQKEAASNWSGRSLGTCVRPQEAASRRGRADEEADAQAHHNLWAETQRIIRKACQEKRYGKKTDDEIVEIYAWPVGRRKEKVEWVCREPEIGGGGRREWEGGKEGGREGWRDEGTDEGRIEGWGQARFFHLFQLFFQSFLV